MYTALDIDKADKERLESMKTEVTNGIRKSITIGGSASKTRHMVQLLTSIERKLAVITSGGTIII